MILLGVEHDFLEVFVSAGCMPQEVCTPLHARGCGGDLCPSRGFGGAHPPQLGGPGANGPSAGVSGAAPPKLKTDVKLACKSIVIFSQSGSFIRQMMMVEFMLIQGFFPRKKPSVYMGDLYYGCVLLLF